MEKLEGSWNRKQTTKPPSWLIHVGQLTGRKELFLRLAKQKKGRLPSTPKRPKQMLGPSFFIWEIFTCALYICHLNIDKVWKVTVRLTDVTVSLMGM